MQDCSKLIRKFLDTPVGDYSNDFTSKVLPAWSTELHLQTQLQIEKTYDDLYFMVSKHSLDHLSISYNGGKDCLVLLVIYMAVIFDYYKSLAIPIPISKIKSVYIHTEPEFEEQMIFLRDSVEMFGLDFTIVYLPTDESVDYNILQRHHSKNIRALFSKSHSLQSGFRSYLEIEPKIKAIIAGVRRTDPYASTLKLEQVTDKEKGWPEFIRINPVLEWNTAEVWCFVRWLHLTTQDMENHITYCPLYDMGYTSLGGKYNTAKNPLLLIHDSQYKAAWEVVDDDIERLGRNQKGKV